MGRVCMGRVCYGPSLSWAEFVMGRDVQLAFLPNNDEIELKQPVSKLASILLGELVAIQITLNYLIEEKKVRDISTILIFCDSQSAVGILQLGWENKSYKKNCYGHTTVS